MSVVIVVLTIAFFSFITFAPEPEIIETHSVLKATAVLVPYLLFTLLAV